MNTAHQPPSSCPSPLASSPSCRHALARRCPIPTDGALAVRFSVPIPPPNSSITLLEVIAACQATPGATCDSVANNFFISPTPTPLTGAPTATTFVNPGPPTPTPNSSIPTATVYENRGPPTPTPPPGATPTAPVFDGTVTQTGGTATVALMATIHRFSQDQAASNSVSRSRSRPTGEASPPPAPPWAAIRPPTSPGHADAPAPHCSAVQ